MFTIGNSLMPQMRKPVASMITPPQAEKSPCISGVNRPLINVAPKYSDA